MPLTKRPNAANSTFSSEEDDFTAAGEGLKPFGSPRTNYSESNEIKSDHSLEETANSQEGKFMQNLQSVLLESLASDKSVVQEKVQTDTDHHSSKFLTSANLFDSQSGAESNPSLEVNSGKAVAHNPRLEHQGEELYLSEIRSESVDLNNPVKSAAPLESEVLAAKWEPSSAESDAVDPLGTPPKVTCNGAYSSAIVIEESNGRWPDMSVASVNSIPRLSIGAKSDPAVEPIDGEGHVSPITSTPLAEDFDSSLVFDEFNILPNNAGSVAAKFKADAEFLENTFKDEDLIVSVSEQPEVTGLKSESSQCISAPPSGNSCEKPIIPPAITLPRAQICPKEVFTVIATTEGDKYVTIDWMKKAICFDYMKVKFKNCTLRNIWKSTVATTTPKEKSAAEWRVLLQLRTYTTWTVTMCLQCEVYSAHILERLCDELSDKSFNLYTAEATSGADGKPMSKLDRPHTGQTECSFDLTLCRLHLNSEAMPSELRGSLLSTYGISNTEQWWMNICCAKPQLDVGLPSDETNMQVLELASRGLSLIADEVYALRSLILITSASGCMENQMKLTGRAVKQLTGNDHRFEAFGYHDQLEADVLTKFLNSKRSNNVRPLRGYTNAALQPTFISSECPIPSNSFEEWEAIKTEDLEKRVTQISGYYQSALRGQWYCQNTGSPTIKTPRVDDEKIEEWLSPTDRSFGSILNPANLVGDPRLDLRRPESTQFVSRFRFPYIRERGLQSILGISLGRARAMMSLIEQGTAHHALVLHSNNVKLGILDILGLQRSLMFRWSIPSAALNLTFLGTDGTPQLILGDAGATLTKVHNTLTFSPIVDVDRLTIEPKPMRNKLLQSDVFVDLSTGEARLTKSAVTKRIILLRHGQNYQDNGRDFGLSRLGRAQLRATAEWLADSMTSDNTLIHRPKAWSAAGLSTDACNVKTSLQESLNIVRTIFVSRLPLSVRESIFGEDSALYEPENLFRTTSACSEGCELHILISDEYHLLKYFGMCFGIDPKFLCRFRIPHAAFIAINVNGADNFAWCPSFGMVAHIPPSLVTSVA